MKKNNKKKSFSLNAEDQENILILLDTVKDQPTYKEKMICLNISIDRIADILENDSIVDDIAQIIIEEIDRRK